MNTSVELCGVTLKNPVMTASGTFGSGAEYSEFTDLNRLGAVVTKGVANVPWPGNPTPRVAEVWPGKHDKELYLMQQKLITFAVPCYNSAAYMRHCIETLWRAWR